MPMAVVHHVTALGDTCHMLPNLAKELLATDSHAGLSACCRYRPNCMLEFPMGGSQAMVDALIR